jgi:hypothetical protein
MLTLDELIAKLLHEETEKEFRDKKTKRHVSIVGEFLQDVN